MSGQEIGSENTAFDPYHKWLGISPEEQPPNYYRLLGVNLFESDQEVIEEAADQRMGHVRTHQTGKYSEQSQQILNELSKARGTLASPEKKENYDEKLKAELEPKPKVPPKKLKPKPKPEVIQAPIIDTSSDYDYEPELEEGNTTQTLLIIGGISSVMIVLITCALFLFSSGDGEAEENLSQPYSQQVAVTNPSLNPTRNPSRNSNSNPDNDLPPNTFPTTFHEPEEQHFTSPKFDWPDPKEFLHPPGHEEKHSEPTELTSTDPFSLIPETQNPTFVSPPDRRPPDRTEFIESEEVSEFKLLEGHDDCVQSVAFSPDGKRAITASRDKTIRLWDLKTGEQLHIFKGHEDWVIKAIFSPDGTKVLSAGWDHTVRLWNVQSGNQLYVWHLSDESVTSLAFFGRGDRAVVGDWGGNIFEVSIKNPEYTRKIAEDRGAVLAVRYLPGGRIVSGGWDKTVKIRNTEQRGLPMSLVGHEDQVTSLDFARDNGSLVSGSHDGTLLLWDIQSGEEVGSLTGHHAAVLSTSISPDGRVIASASRDQTVRLWDRTTGQQRYHLIGHQGAVWSVDISPGKHQVLSGGQDGTVRLWTIHD